MKAISPILGWVFGVLFLIFGITGLTKSPTMGICVLLAGLICIPLVRNKIKEKTGKNISGWAAVGIAVALFTLGGMFMGSQEEKKAKDLGFTSANEFKEAQKNGLNTKEEWDKVKAEIAAKKAVEDEKAKKEAETKALAEKEAKEKAEKGCRQDLKCWAEKHFATASAYCQSPVERMAKYDFKWNDGMLEPKFSRYKWKNKDKGVVTYIGDKVQFQNGFGAFQNHVYLCDYNTITEQVVSVNAQPGRL